LTLFLVKPVDPDWLRSLLEAVDGGTTLPAAPDDTDARPTREGGPAAQ
jgi:hypothetical protein